MTFQFTGTAPEPEIDSNLIMSMTVLNIIQVAIGPSDKAKVYTMMSGTYEKFAEDLERQFPDEKEAIAKYVQLLKVLYIMLKLHPII